MLAALVLAALAVPNPVGFETMFVRDVSRPDIAGSASGRAIRISVWYPAAESAASKPAMRYGDYIHLTGRYEEDARSAATDRRGEQRFVETTRERSRGPSSIDKHHASLMNLPATARMGAVPAAGRHPLVLFPEYRAPATNSIMAEHLASLGYVVVSIPIIGTFELDFDGGLAGMETHIADMRAALQEVARRSYADPSRLALMGVGITANTAVAYATRNPDVDAIVSLEGGLPSPFENGLMQRSPYFDPAILRSPMLIIQAPFEGRDDSLLRPFRFADRWHVELPKMSEYYVLNYGALEQHAPGLLGEPPGPVGAGYEWATRYVVAFLDATLRLDRSRIEAIGTAPEGLLVARFEKGAPQVPTKLELRKLIAEKGVGELRSEYARLRKTEPQPFALGTIFDLANWFGWQKDEDWSIRHALMTIAAESYPDSARAQFALGNACRARRERECAVAAYEAALRLLPEDPDSNLDAATRQRMRRLATERKSEMQQR